MSACHRRPYVVCPRRARFRVHPLTMLIDRDVGIYLRPAFTGRSNRRTTPSYVRVESQNGPQPLGAVCEKRKVLRDAEADDVALS